MLFSTKLFLSLSLSLLVSLSSYPGSREASADEDPFPILPGLEGSVEFWRRVFTQHGRSELIFFDPLDPTKIYKVVEIGKRRSVRRIFRRERSKIMREHGLRSRKRVRAQRGVKERFATSLELSRKYLGQMQEIFREEGLPVELTYLPLVESAYNIRARSPAGAVGMWQFMRSTGKRYLRVNRSVDERRDPLESTRAAAQLLKENYAIFGNWPLAITAYNHGREGIMRAVSKLGSDDLVEIIRNYRSRSFGFASKNFYAEFLAALEVAKKAEEFFPDLEYHEPFPLEELELERAVSVAFLLKPTNVSRSEFLQWNPALSRRIGYIPKWYRVKVPPEKLEPFRAAYQQAARHSFDGRSALSTCRQADSWTCYRVESGETLSQIAKRHGTTIRKIQELNQLLSPHFIFAGEYLKIPNH